MIPPLEPVGEAKVIDSEKSENSGIEIVDVDRVLGNVVAEIIRRAVGGASRNPSTCQPHGKAAGMMVPAVVVAGQVSLAVYRASKFPSPDYQGIVQHAAFLEVQDESGSSLVGILALPAVVPRQFFVLVPAAVEQLHEAHSAFQEATSLQAVGGVGSSLAGGFSVELPGVSRFVPGISNFRNRFLHAEGEFVLSDARLQFRVINFLLPKAIEPGQVVENTAAGGT